MIGLFSEAMKALDMDRVKALIHEKTPETDSLEFKGDLSTKKGEVDPWLKGAGDLGQKAKGQLVAEIIAFANAHGGTLLLGVRESKEKPHYAVALNPLPRCEDLAEVLRHVIRDKVDPQLPAVFVATGLADEPESGIIGIHVPESRRAPHRSGYDLNSTIRRGDACESMTMREIQDLTLERDRGLAGIDDRFNAQREKFDQTFRAYCTGSGGHCVAGIRVTLLPMDSGFDIPIRIGSSEKLIAARDRKAEYGPGEVRLYMPHMSNGSTRPVLRGIRRNNEREDLTCSQTLLRSGMIEYAFLGHEPIDRGLPINATWTMAMVANALQTAEGVRTTGGAQAMDFGMEVEVRSSGGAATVALSVRERLGALPYGAQSAHPPTGTIPAKQSVESPRPSSSRLLECSWHGCTGGSTDAARVTLKGRPCLAPDTCDGKGEARPSLHPRPQPVPDVPDSVEFGSGVSGHGHVPISVVQATPVGRISLFQDFPEAVDSGHRDKDLIRRRLPEGDSNDWISPLD